MTWGERIRILRDHGWREGKADKGSHLRMVHHNKPHFIIVSRHTKREIGAGLANRILKDAGIES
jgi:predicted RNA binding protein YcfA (HicA-like mRNA interferase family)